MKLNEEMKIDNRKDVHKITRKQITMKRQETRKKKRHKLV